VLVLVVVLVLDLWAPKREPDPLAIILFHHADRQICRILEDEHDFSTSAFRLRILLGSFIFLAAISHTNHPETSELKPLRRVVAQMVCHVSW
jgi:hypothetical protein